MTTKKTTDGAAQTPARKNRFKAVAKNEAARVPTLDGLTGHAGALPKCRCYPEPVV